jgi:hypothetical protein
MFTELGTITKKPLIGYLQESDSQSYIHNDSNFDIISD